MEDHLEHKPGYVNIPIGMPLKDAMAMYTLAVFKICKFDIEHTAHFLEVEIHQLKDLVEESDIIEFDS